MFLLLVFTDLNFYCIVMHKQQSFCFCLL
uniref:Uncharacterized protein n=1 Tax=Rhizophora mucronata TaxID=61149 RepID=A0A2P2QYJ9_RHIMU